MAAERIDRDHLRAKLHQKHLVFADVAEQLAINEIVERHAAREIGCARFLVVGHGGSPGHVDRIDEIPAGKLKRTALVRRSDRQKVPEDSASSLRCANEDARRKRFALKLACISPSAPRSVTSADRSPDLPQKVRKSARIWSKFAENT